MQSELAENYLLELEEWSERLVLFAQEFWDETVLMLLEWLVARLRAMLDELSDWVTSWRSRAVA